MPTRVTGDPVVLPSGTLKRIHVNGPQIRQYPKDGIDRPLYIVKHKGTTYHCYGFQAPVVGMQDLPQRMPGCRAAAWLETTEEVTLWSEAVTPNPLSVEAACPA